MKRIMLLIGLLALLSGCHRLHDQVVGSGNIQKQQREVGSFTSISTEGAFTIEVVCQKPQRVEIEGDDNILPMIETEVSNNVLRIKNVQSYSVSKPITLRISAPDLVRVSASGAGRIDVSEIKNEKFELDVNGAPTIRATGQTSVLNVNANGAGKIDARKLRAARVVVESNGVSKVEVNASQELDVTVSGPSHVVYEGDAVVKKTINGPGSVEKKASTGA